MMPGLNIEQRKRLTIGVELAAKPDLLLFLDEPTSGLDSQTAWSISTLIRKLSDNGQAILCTIHQPSAVLFQQFDRLLLLTFGGKTVYFGDLGHNSQTMTRYFEKHGASPCGKTENPAEWMLKVIGAAPGAKVDQDWAEVWRNSSEFKSVQEELCRLEQEGKSLSTSSHEITRDLSTAYAAPFHQQLALCIKRAFQQYWRSPSYIYSKLALCGGTVRTRFHSFPSSILYTLAHSLAEYIHRRFLLPGRAYYDRRQAADVRPLHATRNFCLLSLPNHAAFYPSAPTV
jgi:ATP-binding cassette, subfamily G (WHITE), member 2, PDR